MVSNSVIYEETVALWVSLDRALMGSRFLRDPNRLQSAVENCRQVRSSPREWHNQRYQATASPRRWIEAMVTRCSGGSGFRVKNCSAWNSQLSGSIPSNREKSRRMGRP
ncbi:hypothetical protein LINGRAHAP2_LOCUS33611, partial [Linum grandiflorum]